MGRRGSFDQVIHTLVLHIDGRSWKRVPSFNTGSLANTLSEVVALDRDDVWAVVDRHRERRLGGRRLREIRRRRRTLGRQAWTIVPIS